MKCKFIAVLVVIVSIATPVSVVSAYTNTSPITSSVRWTQSDQSISILDESRGRLLGGGRVLTRGYTLTAGATDNVDLVANAPESANYIRFAPILGYSKAVRDHRYWLNSRASVGLFSTGNDDGFVDFTTQAAARFNAQGRHRFEIDGRFSAGHRVFNADSNRVQANESVDRYHRPSVSARYTFGRQSSRVQLGVWTELQEQVYQNNRNATQFFDHRVNALGVFGIYRLSAKTSLLSGISIAETKYQLVEPGFSSRDSDASQVYLGARWRSTAKTTGEVQFGLRETDYVSDELDNPARSFWSLSVDWRPRVFDVVKFYTSRTTEVSRSSEFNDLERTQYGVRWTHEWDRKIKTRLGADLIDYRFVATGGVRSDDLIRYVAGIVKPVGRKSIVGLGYVLIERDSTSEVFDYEAEGFELTVQSHF